MNRSTAQSRLAWLALLWAVPMFGATPWEELGSPVQETRDAAAVVIRSGYTPVSRARWDAVVAAINVGDTKEKVLEQLRPFHPPPGMSVGGGGSFSETYRLDDHWVLTCWYGTKDQLLIERTLSEHMREVWVEPPPKFSGVWTTYFVNGQRSHEIHYLEGRYDGVFTSFHPDGTKSFVQHYGPLGCDGEDTGYYSSGKVSYRAYYRAGSPVGTWTWFNEDGTVSSTRDMGGS